MARITDENLRFNVIVNGDQAQADLLKLEQQQREMVNVQKELRAQKSLLNKEDKDYQQNLKKLNATIDENNKALELNAQSQKRLRQEIGLTAMTPRQLRQEMASLKRQIDNTSDPNRIKMLNAELGKTKLQLDQLTGSANRAGNAMQKTGGGAKQMFATVAMGATAAIGVITGLIAGLMKIVNVRAQFQKFDAVLTNTLGSKSAAKQAMDDIKTFAAETPFAVDELTASYVKLANQGFQPTSEEMRKLGDLAAATGKGFDQLAEAIIDAQVGEMERLKEFGIRAQKNGDQITFAFKGVQTQVKNNEQAIRDYILSLGDLEGVSGGMEAISKTLGGQLSNLEDNITNLFNSIGEGTEGPISEFLTIINDLINSVNEYVNGSGKSFLKQAGELMQIVQYWIALFKEVFGVLSNIFQNYAKVAEILGLFNERGQSVNIMLAAMKAVAQFVTLPLRTLLWTFELISEAVLKVVEWGQKFLDWMGLLKDANKEQIEQNQELVNSEQYKWSLMNKEVKEYVKTLDETKKKTKELTEEEKKRLKEIADANKALRTQIEQMDINSMTNERARALAQMDFQNEQARLQIEQSKATQQIKNEALLALNNEYIFKLRELQTQWQNEDTAKALAEIETETQRKQAQLEREKQLQQSIFDLKAEYALLTDEQIYEADLQRFIETEAFKSLTVEEQERAREEYRKKHSKAYMKMVADEQQAAQFAMEATSQVTQMFLADTEESQKEAAKAYLLLMLKLLKNQIQIAVAGATAQSLASPESIATFGVAGLAKAAVLTGLIEGVYAVLQSKIQQFETGRYNVTGATDGKQYRNVPYIGAQPTGYLPARPALISETGREAIISHRDLQNPAINSLFNQIRYIATNNRVPQYATGNMQPVQTSQAYDPREMVTQIALLRSEISMYATAIQQWQQQLQVVLNYTDFTETDARIKQVITDVTMFPSS
jgi:hypothetical protein